MKGEVIHAAGDRGRGDGSFHVGTSGAPRPGASLGEEDESVGEVPTNPRSYGETAGQPRRDACRGARVEPGNPPGGGSGGAGPRPAQPGEAQGDPGGRQRFPRARETPGDRSSPGKSGPGAQAAGGGRPGRSEQF